MTSCYYDGADFKQEGVLVKESLFETTYRLDEVYWGIREAPASEAEQAIQWVYSCAEFHARANQLTWNRTEYDWLKTGGFHRITRQYLRPSSNKMLTGEGALNINCALAALIARMGPEGDEMKQTVLEDFLERYPGPRTLRKMVETGSFCCDKSCNIQYQRALAIIDPNLYRLQEKAFMQRLSNLRQGQARWAVYPFYYTVLTLNDISSSQAKAELHAVACSTKQNLLKKYESKDRLGKIRLKALDILWNYR